MRYVFSLLLTLSSLLICNLAFATNPSYDSGSECTGSSSSSTTVTATCVAPSCSGSLMVCGTNTETNGLLLTSGDYNGTEMAIDAQIKTQFDTRTVSMISLASPTAGSHTVTATYTGGTPTRAMISCVFYCGVNGKGTAIAVGGDAGGEDQNLTTTVNNSWAVGIIGSLDPENFTADADFAAKRVENDTTELSIAIADGPQATAGTFGCNWTRAGGVKSGAICMEIKQAAPSARRRVVTVQ